MVHTQDLALNDFQLAADWSESEGKLEIRPVDKGLCITENVIVAFLLNGRVTYIGRSTRNLQEFARDIRNAAGSQVTNLRLRPYITEALANGQKVEIWLKVMPQARLSELNAEKARLNQRFSPPWKA